MAKKSPATPGKKKTKTATSKAAKAAGAGKKTAAKKAKAKKGAAQTAQKKSLLAIDAMPESTQAAIYEEVQNLLASRGVKGQLTSLHLTTDIQPLLCTPPKVRRMVCRKVNGIVRCVPECVDP